MPNAIYPPHWHAIPPPEHPGLDRWLAGLLVVLLALVVMVLFTATAG